MPAIPEANDYTLALAVASRADDGAAVAFPIQGHRSRAGGYSLILPGPIAIPCRPAQRYEQEIAFMVDVPTRPYEDAPARDGIAPIGVFVWPLAFAPDSIMTPDVGFWADGWDDDCYISDGVDYESRSNGPVEAVPRTAATGSTTINWQAKKYGYYRCVGPRNARPRNLDRSTAARDVLVTYRAGAHILTIETATPPPTSGVVFRYTLTEWDADGVPTTSGPADYTDPIVLRVDTIRFQIAVTVNDRREWGYIQAFASICDSVSESRGWFWV